MEYRIIFHTPEGMKTKRMDAANPLSAVNRVLTEWPTVHQITRIETIIETEAGETTQPAEFDVGKEQHIHVNVNK